MERGFPSPVLKEGAIGGNHKVPPESVKIMPISYFTLTPINAENYKAACCVI